MHLPSASQLMCNTYIESKHADRGHIRPSHLKPFPGPVSIPTGEDGRGGGWGGGYMYVKDECNLCALLIGKAPITSHIFIVQANNWAFILKLG
jgi:hypothetical protein